MKFAQRFCITMGAVLAVACFVRAQEPPLNPPQSNTAPPAEEKQRSASETKKQLEQLACGPPGVKFSHRTEKGPQTLPEQPLEKGLVYVVRSNNYAGSAVQAKLAMDGRWVGVNRQANYFYFQVDPGPHYFCLKVGYGPGTVGLLSLVIEKGKTYYLRQNVSMGGTDLDLLTEEKGKEYVAKYHRSLFEEKPKK